MASLFNQLKFKREQDFSRRIQRSDWQFFIPGVNSGIYTPATLCVNVRIENIKATLFGKLSPKISYSNITLTEKEFDSLYNEMTKIKQLRDSNIGNKKSPS